MITLPSSPSRLWLLSFWAVLILFVALPVGVVSWIFVSPLWFVLDVILALVFALAGLFRPRSLSWPYRFWNKIAKSFAFYARQWLTGICFYVIFLPVGWAGSTLRLARPDSSAESLWEPRGTLPLRAYFSQYYSTTTESTQNGWISTLLYWTVRSGNLWVCCLVPFLILLRAFETDEESSFPTNIYTLY